MTAENRKVAVVTLPELEPQDAIDAQTFVDIATDFTIDSEDVRALADQELASIKKRKKGFDQMREFIKAPILESGRRVDAMFRPLIELCDKAEKALTQKILTFDRELATKRAEEQRLANEAAERQRAALTEQAKQLEASGDTATAAVVQEAATLVSAPVVPIAVSTHARSTVPRSTWSAEVTDLAALVKAVAEGRAPIQALQADLVYLNGRARLEKDKLAIDGVKAVPSESLAAKRGAA